MSRRDSRASEQVIAAINAYVMHVERRNAPAGVMVADIARQLGLDDDIVRVAVGTALERGCLVAVDDSPDPVRPLGGDCPPESRLVFQVTLGSANPRRHSPAA